MIPPLLAAGALRDGYASGAFTVADVAGEIARRVAARGADAVWIDPPRRDEMMALARGIEARRQEGRPLPLYGLPFAVKDNIDWAGRPTTAGCPAFAFAPRRSAAVVERLVAAGAFPVGKTNLDQFATGLVGTRSPHGAPRCVYDGAYISGGSSSGSAVTVAAGLASFALGTDTAGSGRVPAAFNNLVGVKPTRGRLSTSGVFPACRSLDCVSIFSLNVGDGIAVRRVAEGFDALDPWSRAGRDRPAFPAAFRFGVPGPGQLEFFGDAEAAELYAAALERLERLGGTRVEVDYAPFREAALLLYQGPWVAERRAALGDFWERRAALDPAVRAVLEGADRFSAVDAFRALHRLEALRRAVAPVWEAADFLALPTTGTTYTVAQVEADPIALNSNLGYYTNFMNLLDLCGLALPAGFRRGGMTGLPFGITLAAPAFADAALDGIGLRWEQGDA